MSSNENERAPAVRSRQYTDWLRRERLRRMVVLTSQAGVLLAFLLLWELLPRLQLVNPFFTSYPSAIGSTFVSLLKSTPQQASILTHTFSTLFATVLGFSLAMLLGTTAAATLWWWDSLYKTLDPYLVIANAMPKTAFVPIFYIWLGPSRSIYAMSLAISLFVTILMIYSGFQVVDANKIKLARTFGASKAHVLTKVILPGSIPTMIATIKVNAGLSLVGVVVGEFQSANVGLGYLIQYGSQIFRLDIVMTAVTVLAVMSSLMYGAIVWAENLMMRWR
jgi:NitT/TauT family transport system permease protein